MDICYWFGIGKLKKYKIRTSMKKIVSILSVLALLMLTGCSPKISPQMMQKEVKNYHLPKLPEKGKALVYAVRPSIIGGFTKFNMYIDDKQSTSEMGYTRGGEYIYFNIVPGTHKLYSDAENWGEITITASAGNIIFIEQVPSIGILYARNVLKPLVNYRGKYHVKKLKLGTIKKLDK